MKKTYINPNVKVVVINTSKHVLQASTMNVQGNYDSESVSIGSRRSSGWDDED